MPDGSEVVVIVSGLGAVPTALWEIVNVCPPTCIVAVRAGPLFEATVKLTVPVPVPDPPDMAIHVAAVVASHPHEAPVLTEKELPPPAELNDWLVEDSE